MSEDFDPYYHWLGIPPQEQPPNHYRLLSLQLYEPNEEVIQHAVDRLMAHIRTFQAGQRAHESQRLLNEISRARICLLNSDKKAHYDRELRKSLSVARPPARSFSAAPPTRAFEAAAPPAKVAPPPTPPQVDVRPRKVGKAGPWWWVGLTTVLAGAVVAGILISPVLFPGNDERQDPVAKRKDQTEIVKTDLGNASPGDENTQNQETDEKSPIDSPGTAPDIPADKPPVPPDRAPPSTSVATIRPSAVEPALVSELADAAGFVSNHVALCQSLSLDSFPALSTRLGKHGYRPTRIRPYVASDRVLITACWIRDQVAWQLIWNKTADEFDTAAAVMLAEGYQPVDVAGYHHRGETRFVAAYRRASGDPSFSEATVGLTADDSSQPYTRLLTESYYPCTNHIFRDAQGHQRESRVWIKQSSESPTKWVRWGRVLESRRPLFQSVDAPLRPLDVTLITSDSAGQPQLLSYSLNAREAHPAAALSALSLQEHRARALELTQQGYVPAGISVVEFAGQPVAVSVWRAGDLTAMTNREPLLQIVGTLPRVDTSEIEPSDPDRPTDNSNVSAIKPVAKLALPSEADLATATKIVELRYANIASQAKTPAAKTVLVKQLLADADKEQDAAVRFAVLQRAREVAEQNGQVELAFEAITGQNVQFETDSLRLQTESMKEILSGAKRNPNRHWLIWRTFQLADEALSAERFDLALDLTATAGNAARRSGENELAKAARDQNRRIEYSQQLRDAATASERVLAETAKDPAANSARGRYLCFVRDDWASGTKHLAMSDDDALARVAAMDQAKPATPLEQLAVADGWMAWAEKADALTQVAVWRRAAFWYATALPKLSGDARVRADEQLTTLGDKVADKSWSITEELPWVEGPPGELRQFKGHATAVYALAVSRNGRWLVSGARDSIRSWDLATGEPRHQFASALRRVESVAFTLRDRFIVGNGGTKELAVWDFRDGRLANRLPTGKSYITCMAASADGELIAWGLRSAGADNVLIWDAVRRRGLRSLTTAADVRSLAFSPEGRRLVTGDASNKVICWDLTTGTQLFQGTVTYPISQVAFSPNGRHIATLDSRDLLIWDLVRGQLAHRLVDTSNPTKIAFLADGLHLAAAGYPNQVNVWDVLNGAKTYSAVIGGSTRVGYLRTIAALPDPRAFVVADDDGDIFLWRIGKVAPMSQSSFNSDRRTAKVCAEAAESGRLTYNNGAGGPRLGSHSRTPFF